MQLLSFRRRSKATNLTFLDLPPELRLKIYRCCFQGSHTRYWREKLPRGPKLELVKVAFCKGPKEHALLAACHQIYDEALPILVSSAYFLLDQTDAQAAFTNLAHITSSALCSLFLARLLHGTKKLVLSKPGPGPPTFRNYRPMFWNVETVEIFGFYPTLQRWLRRDRTISMGWGMWYWKLFFYRSRMRPTKNPRINLSRTARWLHANLDRDDKPTKVYLKAWELEDADGAEGSREAYSVFIDVDTKQVILKERIMFYTKLDRCGSILENEIKHYHDFERMTTRRRNEWLKEEKKREPELYPVTAIASEEEK